MAIIDLKELTQGRVRNLTGHERGFEARKMFELDTKDLDGDVVIVEVPEDLEGITTSFFQGMFSTSVKRSGNDFLEKYHFRARPSIMEQILRGIDRINTRRSAL